MDGAAIHEIGREKFERALAVLEAEEAAMGLTRAQIISLRLYTIFIWGFLSLLIITIIYALAIDWPAPGLSEMHLILIGLIVLGALVCFACAVVLLLLNIPVIVKFARNRRLFRRLGFSDVSGSLWKEYQKTRRGSAIFRKISLGLGIFSLFCLIGSLVSTVAFHESNWLAFGFYLVLSALFVSFYLLQTGKAWLEIMTLQWRDATHLKELMVGSRNRAEQAGLERIPVPAEAIKQFSRIENVQIARSRAQAITESIAAPVEEFSILLSQQVLKVKTGLEPGDQLKVEHALDALMLQPRPASAQKDAELSMFRETVNGTELELVYDIDDKARQVKVLSLQRAIVGSARRA